MKTQFKAARTALTNKLASDFSAASSSLRDVFMPNADMKKRFPDLSDFLSDALRDKYILGVTHACIAADGTLWVRLRMLDDKERNEYSDVTQESWDYGTPLESLNEFTGLALLANPEIPREVKEYTMNAFEFIDVISDEFSHVDLLNPDTFRSLRHGYKTDAMYNFVHLWYPVVKKKFGATLYNVMNSVRSTSFDKVSSMLALHPYYTLEVVYSLLATAVLLEIQPSVLNSYGHLDSNMQLAYTKAEAEFLLSLYTVRDLGYTIEKLLYGKRYLSLQALNEYTLRVLEDKVNG